MSDWQPIETAPKDGTMIILGSAGSEPEIGWWRIWPGIAYNEGCRDETPHSYYTWTTVEPTSADEATDVDVIESHVRLVAYAEDLFTHWMPLPSPPVSP